MKRALLLLLAAAACGCAEVNTPSTNASIPKQVAPPALNASQQLGLFDAPGKTTSAELFVGDTPTQVNNVYPSMSAVDLPSSMAFANEIPTELKFANGYSAESNENGGFGAIYFNKQATAGTAEDKQLAVGLIEDENLTSDDVNDVERAYEQSFKLPTKALAGSMVRYWFWEDPIHAQRLMICAVQSKTDASKFDLTTALGDDVTMDALRMNEAAAVVDRQALNSPSSPSAPQSIGS